MKKIMLLFTMTMLCPSALNGMEAEHIYQLPKELQNEITQIAIASSKNLDDAITIIKKLSESFGVQYKESLNNFENFVELVDMLSMKFNQPKYGIAWEVVSKFNFSEELYNQYILNYEEID